jgi:hypothetical protein
MLLAALTAVALSGCSGVSRPTGEQRADVSHLVRTSLDSAWAGDGSLNRPPTVQQTFVLPNGWGFRMQRCMVETGFTAYTYDQAFGFSNGLERTSTEGTEGLAWYYCSEIYPTYDRRFSDVDDTELAVLYDYYSAWLVPCLSLEGSPVLNIPSAQQFRAGGLGYPGSWNPYLTARLPDSTLDTARLLQTCGPYPAGWAAEH